MAAHVLGSHHNHGNKQALQEAGVLSVQTLPLPRLEVLGVYPSVQTLRLQGLVALAAIAGFAYNARSARQERIEPTEPNPRIT